MMDAILNQLARSTLLPKEMAASILAGSAPPLEDVVNALLVGALDAEAVIRADTRSTWNEKRIARQALIVAFLSALVMAHESQ